MKTANGFAALALAAAVVAGSTPAIAQEPPRVKAGTLSCDISGGIGLIVASRKEVACLFTPADTGPREVYVGAIDKFGLDIGATTSGEMVWAVYAPTKGGYAALAGNYSGAGAEATVGAGFGAHVLVGGSDRTVALQPISVQSQVGINLAVGVGALELRPLR